MKKNNKIIDIVIIGVSILAMISSVIAGNYAGLIAWTVTLLAWTILYVNKYNVQTIFNKPNYIKDNNQDMNLLFINERTESDDFETKPPMAYELGIEDERFRELVKVMTDSYHKNKSSDKRNRDINVFTDISKAVKHKNEMALLCYAYGVFVVYEENPILALSKFMTIKKM